MKQRLKQIFPLILLVRQQFQQGQAQHQVPHFFDLICIKHLFSPP
ncbi:hypothetical protein LRLP16767_LRLP167_01429 [Limosilactobacillus reuteri]|uniref:Uncharacterized protein n=1 Tax=Limosilactobacillus reuteri TaxID=1598 RepID=A0A0U5K1B5_LIMRT|nr:hypothetical protein LRLP16767_LRPG3B_01041 [Limosilactobacillus reuteri]CUR43630.1 hypothetical protein LRLP16767_LRLP167_01429 [Limosilactobacillus reuteri]